MQQGSINRVIPELLKIRITNCHTKVYGNSSQSKVMSKYIEAYGNRLSRLILRHPRKTIQEAKKCCAYFSLIEKWAISLDFHFIHPMKITISLYFHGVPNKILIENFNRILLCVGFPIQVHLITN